MATSSGTSRIRNRRFIVLAPSLATAALLACGGSGAPGQNEARRDSIADIWERDVHAELRADSALAAVSESGPLVLTSPLVIGFMPEPFWVDSLRRLEDVPASAQFRGDSALLRRVVARAGFDYADRYGHEVRVDDPSHNNTYWVRAEPGSVGLMVVAPGFPWLVVYGRPDSTALRKTLDDYARRIGRAPAAPPRS